MCANCSADDAARFRPRGVLLLTAGRDAGVALSQSQLSEEDRARLKVRVRLGSPAHVPPAHVPAEEAQPG